ncbi:MAG: M1 family metallopeptidase [Candidatus Binatia bacterium]
MADTKPYRLPETVIPERYEIRLVPDLASATFTGEETVHINARDPVREIVFNAIELALHEAVVIGGGENIRGTISLDEPNERVTVVLLRPLNPGPWRLRLTFSGTLNDKLHGFYRSTYKDESGRAKVLASTQFESTDARRAFPCWDEPAFKAVFQVTLVVDQGLTAISNAAVVREVPQPGTGKKEVVFADTIKMSTYLVAFIVGEFEATDPLDVDGVPLRVWAVPGKRRLARFALEIGGFSLSFFAAYYGRRYPGDKLDLVAIPDFASGAMENLGAITFRETALLVDEKTATRSELERVADVVSHENAHMWFGDLVTMRWWNGLWLNEAFATFMEMLAVDAWKPEWQRWTSFTLSRASALVTDGLKSTRPIEFTVERPEQAAAMFDVLTYEKGASVLRMLEQYLGAELFRQGISLYLRRHEYGNTETADLWNSIESASQKPVGEIMDTWIFQAGYPLITVERRGGGIAVSQQIFRYLGDEQIERRWHVPIFVRSGGKNGAETQTLLLSGKDIEVALPEGTDWTVVNAGGHGFYRVRYAPELLQRLTQEPNRTLSAVERFNVINDTWATAQADLTPLNEFLELLQRFKDESDHNVWSAILGACHYLFRALEPRQRPGFQAFVRGLISLAASRLGWIPQPGESELTSQLRGELLGALGTLGEDKSTQSETRWLYDRYKQDRTAVDRNIVPALISIVAHTGGPEEYNEFLSRFKTASTPQDEQRYLFALAAFRKLELLERTLKLTVNGEVRSQNAPYLLRSVLFNPEGRERAWAFMKEHWEKMLRQYPDNSIPRMCEGIVALVKPELEEDIKNFFAAHPVKQGGKLIEQHIEKLHIAVLGKQRWTPVFDALKA